MKSGEKGGEHDVGGTSESSKNDKSDKETSRNECTAAKRIEFSEAPDWRLLLLVYHGISS